MIDFGFGGITLGRIEFDDLQQLRSWRNNEAIFTWCRQANQISDHDQQAWFDRQNTDPTMRMYSVYWDNTLIGVCGLTSIDMIARRAEFSLYIGPEFQGEGHGKNALKTLFKSGFDDLNLNLIWGECFDGNPAAKMFEGLGMMKEGTRREFYYKNGKYIDADLYSITSVEFDQRMSVSQ